MERFREGIYLLNQITPQSMVESLHNLDSNQIALALGITGTTFFITRLASHLTGLDEIIDSISTSEFQD